MSIFYEDEHNVIYVVDESKTIKGIFVELYIKSRLTKIRDRDLP